QIMRLRMGTMTEGGAGGGGRMGVELPEDAVEQIRQYYGFDKPVHIRYGLWLWKVLHLDLGNSYIYQDPVWDVIKTRFPISIFLGVTVFLGYAVPGWALGTALLVLFGGGSFWSVFPLGGFRSSDWEYLSFGQK